MVKRKTCIINKDKNKITGRCVFLTSGYRDGCFIIEKGKKRKCNEKDFIKNQGFPLSYKFSKTKSQMMRELGESFPPKAAKKMAEKIKKEIL